ncbi:NAD-P-binding protein [Atractiella rhizophila]|nr:NAD-P-binding protein [Atractiella rhizophila]
MASRPIFVVAGVGNASGTGGATARLFAKQGYRVALIARNAEALEATASELRNAGGDAAAFPVKEYSWSAISDAFAAIKNHFQGSHIRATLYNVGAWHMGSFLDLKEQELQNSLHMNVVIGAAFAQESIKAFFEAPDVAPGDQLRSRGSLLITGATASIRGAAKFGAFAAGKVGLRALSQSLAREFAPQNIHVAHTIIDGGIVTDVRRERVKGTEAEGALEDASKFLNPNSIAESYWYLRNQDRSAWTLELDLRPSSEKF